MRYAIVRDFEMSINEYKFSKWHESEEEAIQEAKRLCEKNGSDFIVLKEIGRSKQSKMPVEFVKEQ